MNSVKRTSIFALLLSLCCGLVATAFAELVPKARVKLVDSLARSHALKFDVPVELLAPRLAHEARLTGALETDSLYLTLKYIPNGGPQTRPPSPRALHQGAPDTVHLFIKPIGRPHQRDLGKWYLERALRDEERLAHPVEPQKLHESGLLKYQIGASRTDEAYSYVDGAGKTVFVRCQQAVCLGYRTWRDTVRAEYRFGKGIAKDIRQIDSLIDQVLTQTYSGAD